MYFLCKASSDMLNKPQLRFVGQIILSNLLRFRKLCDNYSALDRMNRDEQFYMGLVIKFEKFKGRHVF